MKPQDLSEFFNLLGDAKKEKKEEFDKLLKEANIDLDSLVSSAFDGIEKAKVCLLYTSPSPRDRG